MSGKESTGHDLASMIKTNPLIAPPKDEHSNAKHEKESGDFDNDEIQKKMSGLIHNLQSGSPDHDQSHKTPTKVDAERTRSPVAEKHTERPSRAASPQGSKNHETSKVRKSSAGSSGDDEKKKKKETKRDSSDEHHRKSSKSPKPEMKHDSSQTKHDTTVKTDAHKNARHSSTESDDLPRSTSKKTPAKHSPRDNDKRSPSPESKKEHLNNSKASKKEQPKPTHTTDDDKTDDEHHASKSKKKPTNDEHHKTAGEDTDLKKTHSIQDLVSKSIRPSADPHSDTEQAKPKRRRPKRISRTTQTYEHIFRRMERDEHEELVPTNDTDKNCQTRKSQLSPQKQRSSKKSYSIYISSDDYKIEPVNSKKSSSDQRNPSNTRKPAPETGKLLILRPAESGHRSNAVNTQRITSEQAIDLIRNDKKQDSTSAGQRTKSKTRKQPEHAQKLPRVNSPASSTGHDHHPQKANPKAKSKHDSDDDPF